MLKARDNKTVCVRSMIAVVEGKTVIDRPHFAKERLEKNDWPRSTQATGEKSV